MFCQLFGAKGLVSVPGGVKGDWRRWCGAVKEEMRIVAQTAKVVHSEGEAHDVVEEELPEEFLVGDGVC